MGSEKKGGGGGVLVLLAVEHLPEQICLQYQLTNEIVSWSVWSKVLIC